MFDYLGMWLGISGIVIAGIVTAGSPAYALLLLIPIIFQLTRV